MSKKSKKATVLSSTQLINLELSGVAWLGTMENNVFRGVPKCEGIVGYVKARETGALDIQVIGNANNLIWRPLSPQAELELARIEGLWALAEAKSKTWVTAKVFSELTGK
jgi:hypothetical protein